MKLAQLVILFSIIIAHRAAILPTDPNVILILTDGLSFRELEWFSAQNNSQAAHLKRMISEGKLFNNFHATGSIGSLSRAGIMTGLFPWRLGSKCGYDSIRSSNELKDQRQQLPLIPNMAMGFQEKGYYTAHVGKWSLGGQHQNDIALRNSGNCSVPGINQYGFDEYIAMSEGVNSMAEQTRRQGTLYSSGGSYLYKNDQPLSVLSSSSSSSSRSSGLTLTDRQTDEAIRIINDSMNRNRPFYLNLWLDAPQR
jgi:arylsulfatase A-like enzyme